MIKLNIGITYMNITINTNKRDYYLNILHVTCHFCYELISELSDFMLIN